MWYPPCIKGHTTCFKIMLRNQYPKMSRKHCKYHEHDMKGGSWGVPYVYIYIYVYIDTYILYISRRKIRAQLISGLVVPWARRPCPWEDLGR